MRKLFTAKPGRPTCAPRLSKPQDKGGKALKGRAAGLFLLFGIVALQWSFTPAGSGESRAAYLLTDTAVTPVAGKPVATSKRAPARSNRTTTTSSKPVLASNLERETISFGSPTEGPETEVGTSGRKAAVLNGSKTAEKKSEGASKSAAAKNIETVNTNTTNTKNEGASKSTAARNVETLNTNTVNTKNEGTATSKSAVTDKKAINTKAAVAKNVDAVGTKSKTAATANPKNTTSKKITDDANTDTKIASFASSKSEGAANTKAAFANEKTVDGAGAVLNIKEENTGTTSTRKINTGNKSAATTASAKTAANTTATKNATTKTATTASTIGILSNKLKVYDSLHLKAAGLSKSVFTMALKGMSKLVSTRNIKDNLLAIVDYSQPSNRKRLYVIDLNSYQLVYNTFVAHGMNTGKLMAQSFSNKPSSNKSSLGFYITGPAYNGTNGYSLKLTGVEKGINDRALERGIVIHGADYVCEGLIESQGFIGRSWGCPAVAPEISQELIDLLKGGSCLFIYHPSPAYKAKSAMLR